MAGDGRAIALVLILSVCLPFSSACGITVYWGRSSQEGTLSAACSTGLYENVVIAYLTNLGSGRTPRLDLGTSHCPRGDCTFLSSQIQECQSRGIKVLISLGGNLWSSGLSSRQDAREVAEYIHSAFLGGGGSGPLGDVHLDGVDFELTFPSSVLYWDELAISLSEYSTPQRKVYLSAFPQCVIPDRVLGAAIETGIFDYIWVKFYNNRACDYRGGLSNVVAAWDAWTAYLGRILPRSRLFFGTDAAPVPAVGNILPNELAYHILPVIKFTPQYGGIMVWNRLADVRTNYSQTVAWQVCSGLGNGSDDVI